MKGDLKVTINDNSRYMLMVPEGGCVELDSMAIYSMTVVEPCVMRYEGMA